MKKFFESILLSLLLSTSVLMGLSFWLNIKFGFNLFNSEHWNELSRLQATHTPVSLTFYISIALAIFVFIFGLYLIFRPRFRNIFKHKELIKKEQKIEYTPKKPEIPVIHQPVEQEQKKPEKQIPQINIPRPQRLNLPKNISEIAAAKYGDIKPDIPQKDSTEYNAILSEIFTNNNFIVKTNPVISGFTPNLFAIGTNEILWIGAINCDIEKIKKSITKLTEVFTDTLSDIEININGFLIDTVKHYESDDTIKIFHNIEDLKQFISENPGKKPEGEEQENLNAYSEYIDTIINYIKNL
ncbi:MAG: hypothetical protein IKN73_02710 [Alphaproteobacteria bacterium]|nr:hypothetical protein [Alphaproteobacteria bacterium]